MNSVNLILKSVEILLRPICVKIGQKLYKFISQEYNLIS